MDKLQNLFYRRLKENPDRNYIPIDAELYHCNSCLSQRVVLNITGEVYCADCEKLLTDIFSLSMQLSNSGVK